MTKQEFLDALRRMLNRELEADEVADNIQYYSDYIDDAVRKGKSESQVLAELGDPRMIARTILDVDEQREQQGAYYEQADTVVTEDEDGVYRTEEYSEEPGEFGPRHFEVKASGWKVWLILILVLIVIVGILGTAFAILWKLLPFLLIGAGIVWIYHRVTGR
ncbi:MAG: DUF1700 domain-containing protein [Lachnospiraceae bacterium]|nr:DUF1700 domain-containing protein [Lachnospiraceae bacterium]